MAEVSSVLQSCFYKAPDALSVVTNDLSNSNPGPAVYKPSALTKPWLLPLRLCNDKYMLFEINKEKQITCSATDSQLYVFKSDELGCFDNKNMSAYVCLCISSLGANTVSNYTKRPVIKTCNKKEVVYLL